MNADGSDAVAYDPQPAGGETVDKGQIINFFENPIVADLDPSSPGLEVLKGGLTLNQLVNIGVATGQNLPYNQVLQAWDGQTGEELPAFPQAVEDFQLLSSPAVADVSGASGPEAILGTGLYLLRDINAQGQEGAGWPKFTGGWIYGVPGDRGRRRRRQARGLRQHARGLLFPVGHEPPRLRHERPVVDLAPRREVDRRLRHRFAAARLADGPQRHPPPLQPFGHPELEAARGRLDVRQPVALQGDRVTESDPPPG